MTHQKKLSNAPGDSFARNEALNKRARLEVSTAASLLDVQALNHDAQYEQQLAAMGVDISSFRAASHEDRKRMIQWALEKQRAEQQFRATAAVLNQLRNIGY